MLLATAFDKGKVISFIDAINNRTRDNWPSGYDRPSTYCNIINNVRLRYSRIRQRAMNRRPHWLPSHSGQLQHWYYDFVMYKRLTVSEHWLTVYFCTVLCTALWELFTVRLHNISSKFCRKSEWHRLPLCNMVLTWVIPIAVIHHSGYLAITISSFSYRCNNSPWF